MPIYQHKNETTKNQRAYMIQSNESSQNMSYPNMPKKAINGTSKATKQIQRQATKLRININKQLYSLRLRNVHCCKTSWFIIENDVNLRLKEETNKHYNTLINTLNKLITQSEKNDNYNDETNILTTTTQYD
jgi:hypothetical protein